MSKEKKSKKSMPWPENLLADIYAAEWPSALPDDVLPTLDYLLATLPCKARDIQILRDRYQCGKTYQGLAGEFDLTHERIRQIINKTVFMLRHPSRRRILDRGLMEHMKSRERAAYELGYERGYKEAEAYASRPENCRAIEPAILRTPIEALGLSTRSFNILYRAGKRTLQDVAAMSRAQLLAMPNLGRKSCMEIENMLETEYNIKLWEE